MVLIQGCGNKVLIQSQVHKVLKNYKRLLVKVTYNDTYL
jgi:hypothetical protein